MFFFLYYHVVQEYVLLSEAYGNMGIKAHVGLQLALALPLKLKTCNFHIFKGSYELG